MYINKIVLYIIAGILIILCGLVVFYNNKVRNTTVHMIETIEKDGLSVQHYYEREFEDLKKENKQLYDSLKSQKKEIESLTQFKYRVKYSTDTVFIEREEPLQKEIEELPDNTYTYDSETDTLSYRLEINSKLEPNWYKLSADVKDKFTIVNKDHGNGSQSTFIESENGGTISDVTVWQKPNTTKWYERFSFGPTVAVGYDPIYKNPSFFVGIGVTYNILGN